MKPSLIAKGAAFTIVVGLTLLNSACSRDQSDAVGPIAGQRRTINTTEAIDVLYGRVTPDDGLEPVRITNTTHTAYFTVEDVWGSGLAYSLAIDEAGTTGVGQVSIAASDQCGILSPFESRQVPVTYTTLVAGMGRISVTGSFAAQAQNECPVPPLLNVDAGSVRVPVQDSPLTLTIGGPTNVGHYETCSWTANRTGGVPPYSYSWGFWEDSPSAQFFLNSYSGATTSGWGYNYGLSYATIHLHASVGDAAGQSIMAFKDVALYPYALYGCY